MTSFYNNKINNGKQRNNFIKSLETLAALSQITNGEGRNILTSSALESCLATDFDAINIGPKGYVVDVYKDKIGIGAKTFNEDKYFQTIGQFNSLFQKGHKLNELEIVKIIAKERNNRIDKALKEFNLDFIVYLCITRNSKFWNISECFMEKINISNIKILSTEDSKNIKFSDGIHTYQYVLAESKLKMDFSFLKPICNIKIPSLSVNDFEDIVTYVSKKIKKHDSPRKNKGTVYFPLYSNKDGENYVPERCGINDCNGIKRGKYSVNILITSWNKNNYLELIPFNKSFKVKLEDNTYLDLIMNDRYLKSVNGNDLGKFLRVDTFNVDSGYTLTYKNLQSKKIDTIKIDIFEDIESHEISYELSIANFGDYEKYVGWYKN